VANASGGLCKPGISQWLANRPHHPGGVARQARDPLGESIRRRSAPGSASRSAGWNRTITRPWSPTPAPQARPLAWTRICDGQHTAWVPILGRVEPDTFQTLDAGGLRFPKLGSPQTSRATFPPWTARSARPLRRCDAPSPSDGPALDHHSRILFHVQAGSSRPQMRIRPHTGTLTVRSRDGGAACVHG